MRKITSIIIGIIGILAIGGLIYYFVSKTPSLPAGGEATEQTPMVTALSPFAALPTASKDSTKMVLKLNILSDEQIFDYWFASSTQEIFGITEKGKIVKIVADKDIVLSEQTVENLNYILPSPDGQKILAAFGPASQPQFGIFDLVGNSWSLLPAEIKSAAWSPESKRLAAVVEQNGKNDLTILNLEEKKTEKKTSSTILKNFAFKDIKMEWLKPDEIIFTQRASISADSAVWRLGLSKLAFSEVVPSVKGLLVKWLRENLGLKFQNQKTDLITNEGKVIYNFPFLVLPDKCLATKESVYCFLFGLKQGVELPDDYWQKVFYSRDSLFKFDLNNLQAPQLVFDNWGKEIDAFHPRLLGEQILFVNRYDNLLYGLEVGLPGSRTSPN